MAADQAPPAQPAPPPGGGKMLMMMLVMMLATQGSELIKLATGGDSLPDAPREPVFDQLSAGGKVHISFCTS